MTSKIKVDNINKVSDDSNIIKKCGTTITLGASGDSIALASGATQTGFGRTGTVDWQTGSIKTSTFTAANGEGYFANTSGGAFTMNLPAGTAGNIVSVVDYTNTFQTHNLTITPNGSQKIGGVVANATLSTQGQSVTFVYVDDTEGWKNVQDSTSNVTGTSFITATGGTITCCGDFKVHTFTGPGTFCVSTIATAPANNVVDYFVVAGGGGAGGGSNDGGGGGGAGGFRLSNDLCMPAPQTSPLANPTGITLSAQPYPISVGAGGSGSSSYLGGAKGSDSTFDSITSAGGGVNSPVSPSPPNPGQGGSAAAPVGGAGAGSPANSGNVPPVSPPQGNNSGTSGGTSPNNQAGGGGGAGAAGSNASPGSGGQGGIGSYVVSAGFAGCNGTTGPVGSTRYFAAGGDGGGRMTGGSAQPAGGGGQGSSGDCGPSQAATAGTVNTGSGGGGGAPKGAGQAGGSGVVIIRYKFQ